MNKQTKMVFLIEIEHQCDYALYATREMQKALDRWDSKTFWFYSQAFLVSTANISKLLWGTNSQTYFDRTILREALGISNSSVLKSRKVRNSFEHFDERLDSWAINSSERPFFDSNIGPKHMFEGIKPKDHLRFFDTEEISINFKGDSFKVKPIIKALEELKVSLRTHLEKVPNE